MRLRLNHKVNSEAARQLRLAWAALPPLLGDPIYVATKPDLTAQAGKLLTSCPDRGTPVYAGTFLRKRSIVLEESLIADAAKLRLIFLHEIFHFVWARLGNRLRSDFAALVSEEISRRARGELGESAGVKKTLLSENMTSDRRWRDYICESFCDTAAWVYAGFDKHPDFTLAPRWNTIRKQWCENVFSKPRNA